MEDIIVYLIFIAFALLSRLLTKKKDQQAPPSNEPSQDFDRPRNKRQPTFEELLREFTGESNNPQNQPEVKPVAEYSSYEDNTYEVENYEEQYARDEEARQVYERSVHQAKDLKTIDELVDYDKVKTKLDQFDPYERQERQTLADEIRRQLQNPHEIKKAVIYSEILQRKY